MPVPRSVKFSSWFVLHLAMLLVAAFLQTLVTLADVGGSIWMVGAKLLSSLLVGLLPSSCLPAASVSAWLGLPPLISWWPAAVGFHWLSTATNRLEGRTGHGRHIFISYILVCGHKLFSRFWYLSVVLELWVRVFSINPKMWAFCWSGYSTCSLNTRRVGRSRWSFEQRRSPRSRAESQLCAVDLCNVSVWAFEHFYDRHLSTARNIAVFPPVISWSNAFIYLNTNSAFNYMTTTLHSTITTFELITCRSGFAP